MVDYRIFIHNLFGDARHHFFPFCCINMRYDTVVCALQTFLKEHAEQLEQEMVQYAYRAGQPMIIDARTLHSVSPNVSTQWRVVVWFIFDSF